MKSSFTLFIFLSCLSQIAFAQQSLLDPSFGKNGTVKTDMGLAFNYVDIGKQVLLQSDGSIYLAFEGNLEGLGISSPTTVVKIHSDGSPDVSYGNNGYSVSVPIFSSHSAIQADGKIIIAGSVNSSFQIYNQTNFAVARLNTDGSLDHTFGKDGIVVSSIDNSCHANSIAIREDGKIVVAGSANYPYAATNPKLALVRYNQDGSLDQTFNGTGAVEAKDLGWANSVAIQSDGKIVVAGKVVDKLSNYTPTVIRYNENGSVDSTFDGGLSIMGFGSSDNINSIAVQSDGKIVATGYKMNGNSNDFAAIRLNTDGSPDVTFDEDGYQTTDFGETNDTSMSVVIQSDGKIVLAGYSSSGSTTHFAICRYNIDGSLDNTFNVNGMQTTVFGSAKSYANSLAIQADGKLVAMGYKYDGLKSKVTAARYNADGSPDNSFGESGTLANYIEQGNTHFTSTAIQYDGKVLAAGYSWNGSHFDFAVARYNTNGTLDNTFGTSGKQLTNFGNTDDTARSLVIQNDGKFLLAGSADNNFAIARYNSDGSLDNTFGINGMQVSDFGSLDYATSIKLQSDGKIIVGGTLLARYNANGSLDISFGSNGKVMLPFICNDIAIQNDNKIVVVSDNDHANFGMVARYSQDGSLDNTFGRNGIQSLWVDDITNLVGKSVKIGKDGKVIIGGYSENTFRMRAASFLLIKLQTNGTPDNTFGNNGVLIPSNVGSLNYATSMLIDNDNKVILAGYSYNESNYNFTIKRFNDDGSADNTFGGNGLQITDASSANNSIAAIALLDDKLYVAGYGQYPGNLGVVARYLIASGGPLPVTLIDFEGSLKNKIVLLEWQTASEHNLSHFTIERSSDGRIFNRNINSVNALGNSNTKIHYSTVDNQPLNGYNYYRLKSVDIDGKFKYSQIVAVNNRSIFTLQINPNPATNMLFLKINSNSEKTNYQIIDVMGRKLREGAIILNEYGLYPIDISSLSKGTYIINLQTKTKMESRKFIKN